MNGLELADEISKINLNINNNNNYNIYNIYMVQKIKIHLLTADEPSEELKSKNKFDSISIKPMKLAMLEKLCNEIKNSNNQNKNFKRTSIDSLKNESIFLSKSEYLKTTNLWQSNSEGEILPNLHLKVNNDEFSKNKRISVNIGERQRIKENNQ